ncbi:hypothetical protein PENTCL1PPCAC_17908, partial [Pristionchus entomophagus]
RENIDCSCVHLVCGQSMAISRDASQTRRSLRSPLHNSLHSSGNASSLCCDGYWTVYFMQSLWSIQSQRSHTHWSGIVYDIPSAHSARSCVVSVIQASTFAFLLATFHGHQYEKGETTSLGMHHPPQCFNSDVLMDCIHNVTDKFNECNKLESVSLLSVSGQLRRTPFFDHVLTEFTVVSESLSIHSFIHISCFKNHSNIKALAKLSYFMVIPLLTLLLFLIFAIHIPYIIPVNHSAFRIRINSKFKSSV